MSYNSLSILDNNNPVYTFSHNLSDDFIAGFLAAIRALDHNLYLELIHNSGISYVINRNDIFDMLDSYIKYTQVPFDDIITNNYNSDYGKLAWWIQDEESFTLYLFRDNEFINGFITAMNLFDIDFRDFIAGPPFITLENNTNSELRLHGYDIQRLIRQRPQMAPPTPFYTGSHNQFDTTDEVHSSYPRDYS